MVQDQEKRNIELLKSKDYDTLLKENEKLVYYTMNKFKAIPFDEKEDYYQLGMLTLYKCALYYDFDLGVKFSTYALTALSNAFVNSLKSYNKIKDNETSYNQTVSGENGELDEMLYFLPSKDDMDTEILTSDLRITIESLILKLTKTQQIYMREYLFENKTYRQIGIEHGRSHQAVQNSVTRGIERLRTLLKNRGIDENYF